MLLKKIVGAVALVGAVVPVVLAVRKRLNIRTTRNLLAAAMEAGRKAPHEGKPRKARRLARHLAKKLTPAAGTA